jgi:hypothetical protein
MKYAKTIDKYFNNSKDIKLCYNKIIHDYEISNIILSKNTLEYKKLKKIIKSIILNNYTIIEPSNNICCVCLDNIENNNIVLSCGHNYHFNCLMDTLNYGRKCCLCRKMINSSNTNKTKNEFILDFIMLINQNLEKIENFHNKLINKIIYYEHKKSEYILNIFRYIIFKNIDNKIQKIKKILIDFDTINYIGIKKIVKKFKKNTNIDLSFTKIINMNFYKYIIN